MIQTRLKSLLFFPLLFSLSFSACGVKGPPEPPLPTEASVKKIEAPAAKADILDVKADDKVKTKDKDKTKPKDKEKK